MRLTFLGAAGEVTGSCFLVETGEVRFLVDCGLFQGGRDADRRNREALDLDPRSVDFLLLTHAHIDHSGLLPRFYALGFRGPVYATPATCDLLSVMLPDAAHIQEKEAEWSTAARRRSPRLRTRDVAPLYTVAQADAALRLLQARAYDAPFAPHASLGCTFRDAGHILGSSIVEVEQRGSKRARRLVFSGDLGQPGHPIVRDPTPVAEADVLLVESTYGNRLHKGMAETLDELVHALNDTLARKGGNVIMPAFAVGRTQDMLFLLADLQRRKKVPPLQIYVDSPMALAATRVTMKHPQLFDPEAGEMLRWMTEARDGPRIHFVQDVQESIALNQVLSGAVIISASGMCEAGRIKYHLRYNLPRAESTIIITGFQAAGTLGRRLVDGARRVRIFGEDIPVRADIYTIGGLSAHADQAGLTRWLSGFRRAPKHVFVVHGEPTSALAFQEHLKNELGWDAEVPTRGTRILLS